ncbi:MAG: hypothetical protein ACR2HY_03815 [Acidimicrobiales bacterium]
MIVLLVILVVAAIGGIAAYVVMQVSGTSLGSPSSGGGTQFTSGGWTDRRGGALAERIADAPSGCLIAVLIVVGVWVALWAVVLVLGLRVLSA